MQYENAIHGISDEILHYVNNALTGLNPDKTTVSSWFPIDHGVIRRVLMNKEKVSIIINLDPTDGTIFVGVSEYKGEWKVGDPIYRGPLTLESATKAMGAVFYTVKSATKLYRQASKPLTKAQKYMIQGAVSEWVERNGGTPTGDDVDFIMSSQSKEWDERFEACGKPERKTKRK